MQVICRKYAISAMEYALALAIGGHKFRISGGAIISMPLKAEGMSKGKAFLYGVLSGVVEPIGAVLTVVASGFIIPVLPYFSFCYRAMIRCNRRINSRNVTRQSLKYRYCNVCSRFYTYDDS